MSDDTGEEPDWKTKEITKLRIEIDHLKRVGCSMAAEMKFNLCDMNDEVVARFLKTFPEPN